MLTDEKLMEMAREVLPYPDGVKLTPGNVTATTVIIAAKLRSVREQTAQRCAGLLCERCAGGDVPQKRIEFSWRWSHAWKPEEGNGHSLCGASVIWDHAREFSLKGKG